MSIGGRRWKWSPAGSPAKSWRSEEAPSRERRLHWKRSAVTLVGLSPPLPGPSLPPDGKGDLAAPEAAKSPVGATPQQEETDADWGCCATASWTAICSYPLKTCRPSARRLRRARADASSRRQRSPLLPAEWLLMQAKT